MTDMMLVMLYISPMVHMQNGSKKNIYTYNIHVSVSGWASTTCYLAKRPILSSVAAQRPETCLSDFWSLP